MFNLWKHPKTQAIRLYIAPKLIKPAIAAAGEQWKPKTVKAWLQEDGDSWALQVAVRTDDPVPPDSIEALKAALLTSADLTGQELWADLIGVLGIIRPKKT